MGGGFLYSFNRRPCRGTKIKVAQCKITTFTRFTDG